MVYPWQIALERLVTEEVIEVPMPWHSSHDVTVAPDNSQLVIKRYVPTTHRAPQREWRALRLLHKYAPGLAPEPVSADLSANPPMVVMSRLAGESLRGASLTSKHLDALGEALQRLHTCLPLSTIERMGHTGSGSATAGTGLRRRLATISYLNEDATVAAAFEHADAWLRSREAAELATFQGRPVFARADHNLPNFLIDGDCVRLVDFEYSGRGDRAGEFAELVEHISARTTPDGEWQTFLSRCEFDAEERRRLAGLRRMTAIWWLLILLPGQPGHERNPPGTLQRQAARLLAM